MQLIPVSTLLLAGASSAAAETVLGAYLFVRHGDRTPKSLAPSNLTDLGYAEVYQTGSYYRSRYLESDSNLYISGINSDIVKQSQIEVSAPVDDVLQNSAQGFLQGLYPAVGTNESSETLANGTTVSSPLNGYQLIPVDIATTGSGSEDTAWLQGSTGCYYATLSSNEYFTTSTYSDLYNSTKSFYSSILPAVNRVFNASQTTFKNAYLIYDYLNVARIHNATYEGQDLITDDVFYQLRTLADTHEYNLAYNSSAPIRAITGSTIAAEIVEALNSTITGAGKLKLQIQFGAYAGMFSYFGLANLTAANADFYGVPDYASSLVWELVTNATVESGKFPSTDDISVRFSFANGSATDSNEPTVYPLFGGSATTVSWADFVSQTSEFSIDGSAAWCQACGNSTGVCSAEYLDDTGSSNSSSSSGSSSGSSSSGSGSGMSNAVAGVIGAFVTLAVVLGLEALVLLVGGYTLVSKKKLAAGTAGNGVSETTKA